MTSYRPLGFGVSGLLHLGLALLVLGPRAASGPVAETDVPLGLTLSMFVSEPVAAGESQPAQAPERPGAVPEPESEPEPEPERKPKPEPEPEPEPEPQPKADARPERPAPPQPSAIQRPDTAVAAPTAVVDASRRPVNTVTAEPDAHLAARPPSTAVPDSAQTDAAALGERQRYLAHVVASIRRKQHYPRRSRRRGEEGTVTVRFVIEHDGRITGVSIIDSSGHSRLDQAAIETLRRAAPFEPIPPAMNRQRWPLSVPIAYSLRG